jgi:soluble lytic murein transglycosylase-like protein
MRIFRPLAIGTILVLAQISAFAAQVAVLRNGFSIRFERKEQKGNSVRLYTGTGFVDIASDQIASFEVEETPVSEPQPAAQPAIQPPLQPVATVTQPAAPATTMQIVDIDQVVREASTRNRIDPDFVSSVIKAESDFKVRAVSKKGAQGLMQLMPGTAAQLGVTDPFDPKANIEAGTAHLGALLDLYHDDPIKALAAYNAGAHRVKQYNGVPPYAETRAYVRKIVHDYNNKKRAQMKAAATAAKTPPAATTAASAKTASSAKTTPPRATTTTAKPAKKTVPQQAGVTKTADPA